MTFEDFPTSTTAPLGVAGGFDWNPLKNPSSAFFCSSSAQVPDLLARSPPNAIYNKDGAQPVSFEVVGTLHIVVYSSTLSSQLNEML